MSPSTPRQQPIGARRSFDTRTRMALDTLAPALSFADVFAEIWQPLDLLYRSFPGDGLLVVAVAGGRDIDAYLHVPLDPNDAPAPHFAILGRHSACDLVLHRDESVSLRHLAVSAQRKDGELRLRLVDLGTGVGLATEDGQRCCGLGADGAAFVSLGLYQLFLLPTGSLAPLPWGNTAAESWAAIPDRVYVDRRAAGTPLPGGPRVRLVASGDRRTIATQILDPPTSLREPKPGVGARGPKAAQLTLRADAAHESYDVHTSDLARGLLIGRYDRCAFGAQDDRLSRVHLLIIRSGDDTYAIDTASSNGTTADGARIRQLQLGADAELALARSITLVWARAGDDGAPSPAAPAPPASNA
jgi:hypothetical protein